MQSSSSFPHINFYCKSSFYFGQSSKCLSTDHLTCEHRCFYMATYVRLVSYILTDLGPSGNFSQSKWIFSCNPTLRLWELHHETLHAYFRLPQSRLQASTKGTYAHDTRPFPNGTLPSQFKTNWINIIWRTWSRLEHTASATCSYNVYTTFLRKFRRISRKTSGTTKKLEFQRKPEDFHLWEFQQKPENSLLCTL